MIGLPKPLLYPPLAKGRSGQGKSQECEGKKWRQERKKVIIKF
jgi:hypothetical protein